SEAFNRRGHQGGNPRMKEHRAVTPPGQHPTRADTLRRMGGYAVVFPGQGSQSAGMADPWVGHPAGRAVLEEASEAMGRDVVAGCHDDAALATTAFVQPALLAVGLAGFAVCGAEGMPTPAGVAGHSLGEFAALVAAGVLTLPEAL